jgi:hypothetical protein
MTLSYRPMASFCFGNLPLGGSFMAAFKAYLDDSGDEWDAKHSACSIGGFLGTADAWAYFEAEWKRLLSEELPIDFLHMKDFAHHKPPYDRLSEPDRVRVLTSLIRTIKDCGLAGFGAVIRLPDLRRFNLERGRNLEARPLALYVCMNDMYVEDPWREIEIILDKFVKPHSVIEKAEAYAASHWSDDVSQNSTCLPIKNGESYRSVVALQAADFIAYEIKKNVESRRGWFDAVMDDDPDTWMETQQKWLTERGLPFPYLRKSLSGLLDAVPTTVSIWGFNVFCSLDDRRGGKWSVP